jgi:glycosyltransferase involved in cell wall biosynthesis
MARLISVIMPVFNAEKFIADAIASVLCQSYPQWELLIVNDGSSDQSEKIIRSFTDDRIRYFVQPNKGVSAARNNGLQHMAGDFFCFLDADDILPEDSLALRLALFEDEAVHFADGCVDVFDSGMSLKLRTWSPGFKGYPFHRLIRLDGHCFFGPTWMVRVKPGTVCRLDEDLRHGEDLFFYMTIAQQGKYTYTSSCILHYRKNPGSAMSNLDGLAKGYTALRRKIKTRFKNDISWIDNGILELKTRKIMFLSFLSERKILRAVKYLFFGSI